jgi:phospholipase/lecithinase/hemolysin
MNPIFSRTFKALCAIAVAGVLTACGSSSTVDPFKPTRVIGLGDGYNDPTATVRETGSTTGSVVEQVATYFGQTNVVSKAHSGKVMADLDGQIQEIIDNEGGFSSGDLVVIAVGTFDVKANANPLVEVPKLVAAVTRLKSLGVTHTLIMPVLEFSRTPWGRTNSFEPTATPTSSKTNTFNSEILSQLSSAFGGRTPNSVIYANASVSPLTSLFLTATSQATYGTFTDTGYTSTTACGGGGVGFNPAGCTLNTTAYTTMLFADGIHLTPAGNRWVAQYLYNATAQGWR